MSFYAFLCARHDMKHGKNFIPRDYRGFLLYFLLTDVVQS
jgi:hypothetical protein